MKIIHIGWYHPDPTGGVVRTILEQTNALHQMGFEVEIWNFCDSVEYPTQLECASPFPVWRLPIRRNKLLRCLSFHEESGKWINGRLGEVDVFHIHSVFVPENALIATLGRPYVITPNGGWSNVVLNGKRKWLKRLWIFLIEMPMWSRASAIQAVSKEEETQLLRLRKMAPIQFIPNGTTIPDAISTREERDCYLFIGRIDCHQKGLDILFDALRLVKESGRSIPKVIVAGPDYRGGRALLEELRERYKLSEHVELMDAVLGEQKDRLFRRARLFVHTSRWEGLPLVLLEALGYGIPCLLTPGTNVASEWAAAGCAFKTSDSPSEIAESMIRLSTLGLEDESRAARTLAQREYSWPKIGDSLSLLYSRISTGKSQASS